jgi:hypothetical protein
MSEGINLSHWIWVAFYAKCCRIVLLKLYIQLACIYKSISVARTYPSGPPGQTAPLVRGFDIAPADPNKQAMTVVQIEDIFDSVTCACKELAAGCKSRRPGAQQRDTIGKTLTDTYLGLKS